VTQNILYTSQNNNYAMIIMAKPSVAVRYDTQGPGGPGTLNMRICKARAR
jgi:hypothetical protein